MKYLLLLTFLSSNLFASPQGFPVETTAVIGVTPATALAANKDRGYLIIQNNGSANCQVKFTGAITGTEGLILGSGQNYEPHQAYLKSAVFMKCAASGSSIVMLETNF